MKMYDVKSMDSNRYIDDTEVLESIEAAKKQAKDKAEVGRILEKAGECRGLTHREVAALLELDDDETLEKMYITAKKVKEKIYGKRIVLFAPLYLSSYCVNNCRYCGYRCANNIGRHQLTQEEVRAEIRALESMGHKRLLLEAGEDDVKCPIDYILECIDTIYSEKFKNGSIRRVNVDIAGTTEENYRKLKAAPAAAGGSSMDLETYRGSIFID